MKSVSKKDSKVCIRCSDEKSLDEFSTARQNKDGKKNTCKTCEYERSLERNGCKSLVIGEDEMEKMPFDWIWGNL